MPFRSLNKIFDHSKTLSLEFANSAFSLKQCKFAPLGTLPSLRMVNKNFVMFAPRHLQPTDLSVLEPKFWMLTLKVGEWRIIYEINHDEKVVTVHRVGHRREIYK